MIADGGGVVGRFKHQIVLFASISLQIIRGLADNPKDETKAEAPPKSSKNTGREVLLIFLAVATVVGLSILLFKLWQKKKREEQHARLLRLFDEDDELEVELGLRD